MSKRKNVTAKVWNKLQDAEKELLHRSLVAYAEACATRDDFFVDDYSFLLGFLYVLALFDFATPLLYTTLRRGTLPRQNNVSHYFAFANPRNASRCNASARRCCTRRCHFVACHCIAVPCHALTVPRSTSPLPPQHCHAMPLLCTTPCHNTSPQLNKAVLRLSR